MLCNRPLSCRRLIQSGDSHRDAVAIRGHRVCGAVGGVDVQEKILSIQPADPRALGQPLNSPTVARGLARQPHPGLACAVPLRVATYARPLAIAERSKAKKRSTGLASR